MTTLLRQATLDHGVIDGDGRFPMRLFTSGEATDGHILSMRGAELPARSIPLLMDHGGAGMFGGVDSSKVLGSVETLERGQAEIRATGRIELEGEGPTADIRRDVALMISEGHIRSVSGRWEPIGPQKARSELPKGHPARVDPRSETGRKAFGIYFSRWRPVEGSVVAIGADAQAEIGGRSPRNDALYARAADPSVPLHVRQFWRSAIAAREMTEASNEVAQAILHGRSVRIIDIGPPTGQASNQQDIEVTHDG